MKPKNNRLRWLVILAWLLGLILWLGTQQLTVVETILSALLSAVLCLVCLMLIAAEEGRI